MRVTVFTPTYNRAHTLGRAYLSLRRQSFTDFEWLIIDDGSTDNTAESIAAWKGEDNFFPIRYYRKPNGGKHTAHNQGVSLAQGEYFAILDSDDWYDLDALKILVTAWESMSQDEKSAFSNVEALCRLPDGRTVGQPFPEDVYDSDNLAVQEIRKGLTDTMGMYRLAVLREFPFPEVFQGSYVPEALVWNRIADRYRTRFLNATVGYKEYLQEGITRRSLRAAFAQSEPAVIYNREMSARKRISVALRLKSRANVYRYSYHNKMSILEQLRQERGVPLAIPFVVVGYLVHLKDRMAISITEWRQTDRSPKTIEAR